MSMPSRVLPWLLAVAAILGAGGCGGGDPDPDQGPHNVLLITVDTLRADHLGSYGHALDTSSNIDQLARDGVRFADCTVQWPKTWPSMASLMTGMYPRTTGIKNRYRTKAPNLKVLSDAFQEAGYATAAVVGNFNVGRTLGFDQGFDHFVESWEKEWQRRHGDVPFKNEAGKVKEYTNATIITDEGLDWLARRDPSRPFFLWLHYMDPHGPYLPPEEYADLYQDVYPVQRVPLQKLPAYQVQKDPAQDRPINDLGFYKAQYLREIRYLDDELGRLFRELESMGLLQDTLTAFTADHGESLDEHDYYLEHGKYSYQVNAHVPLILHWPSVLAGGRVVEDPVGVIDLSSTLLDLASVPVPATFEGISLAGLARGDLGATPPAHVFMESGYHPDRSQLTVRRGRWKLIQVRAKEDRALMQGSAFELYDLEEDPAELHNLANERPDVVKRLAPVLSGWFRSGASVDGGTEIDLEGLDPEQIELLRALGYID